MSCAAPLSHHDGNGCATPQSFNYTLNLLTYITRSEPEECHTYIKDFAEAHCEFIKRNVSRSIFELLRVQF
jgi:hypothetical protein